jgi:hypothetical protein
MPFNGFSILASKIVWRTFLIKNVGLHVQGENSHVFLPKKKLYKQNGAYTPPLGESLATISIRSNSFKLSLKQN